MKRSVIELSTGRTFSSAEDAGRATGTPATTIRLHIAGRVRKPRFAYYSPNQRNKNGFLTHSENVSKAFLPTK